jgi:hypothetical protein
VSIFGKMTAPDAATNAQFGWATSMSADGLTLLVGAPSTTTHAVTTGAAYVLMRSSRSIA